MYPNLEPNHLENLIRFKSTSFVSFKKKKYKSTIQKISQLARGALFRGIFLDSD